MLSSENIAKCNGMPYKVIESRIPWHVHHDGTLVLSEAYDGHVFILIKNDVHYIGDATGLIPPCLLGAFSRSTPPKACTMPTNTLYSVVLRRFQCEQGLGSGWQSLAHENVARSAVWTIAQENNLTAEWVAIEKRRVERLLAEFSVENLKLIYPMVRSAGSAVDDVGRAYTDNAVAPLKLPPIFHWVRDMLTQGGN